MNAIRAAIRVTTGIGFALVLAACSQNAPTPAGSRPDSNSWNGAPTSVAARITPGKTPGIAVPLAKWSVNPDTTGRENFSLTAASPHRPQAFSLTGTGAAVAKEIFSPVFSLTPGHTYTFSAVVDQSKLSGGPTFLWISNPSRNKLYASGKVPPGQLGRFGFRTRIPENVHKIRFGFYTAGGRVEKGAKVMFSDPMVTSS